ncbi:MAG: RNA pseudouridine synthase [Treponema sp.]|jgi:23S rRNA pseudouridine1911/1915/1917 synthase|nr:RNA pseudouridine synthase [Treponema sp.]
MPNNQRPETEGQGVPALSERILYKDAECVVVNKLCGEAAEGAGKGMADLPVLLADALAAPEKDNPQGRGGFLPAAVHRLDVPVSGCCLFARTPRALAFLNTCFSQSSNWDGETKRENVIEKHYWAITEIPPNGKIVPGSAELVHWIKTDPKTNKSTAFDEPGADMKKGILRYRILGRGDRYLFIDVELLTGRHHQIRAQFAKIGLHIKGDLKYGSKRSEKSGGIRLHAHSLSFPDPSSLEKRISVTALPPVRDNLWDSLLECIE